MGCVQLDVVYLCPCRETVPVFHHPHSKQRGFLCAEGASCISVCAHCLVSCLKPSQARLWLLLLPGPVLHWGGINCPSASQGARQFPAPHQKVIHVTDQQGLPEGAWSPARLTHQKGRNVSHLCFNGYLMHLDFLMRRGNQDACVPRKVQDKIHGVYGMHTKHIVYKEEI